MLKSHLCAGAFARISRVLLACIAISLFSTPFSNAIDSTDASTRIAPPASTPMVPPASTPTVADQEQVDEPWEYSPYRIKVWIASDDLRAGADQLSTPIREFIDRSFSAAWRLEIGDAPAAVHAAANRNFHTISYESITAADPVLAIKRDHGDAAKIRIAADVATYVKKCISTPDRLAAVKRQGELAGNPTLDGVDKIFETIEGDAFDVFERWKDPNVEGVLLSRGMVAQLKSPEAKVVRLPINNSVDEDVEANDKIFVVHIDTSIVPFRIEVAELDCLMRNFSGVLTRQATDFASLPAVVGQSLVDIFRPIVRIEDAGQKNAVGVVRAAGLVLDEASPVLIKQGEFLQPMVRKNDRSDKPLTIGMIPWAFLHVTKVDIARVEMDLYAGRMGGLQGRKNNRTFRMALRTRPVADDSTIRLHAQGNPKEPLVGYELYEKELKSIEMTFVGRTNWDGKIVIGKSDAAMRLLYVKNGGAVLARLPIVPGLYPIEIADLSGDDQRLRAEAYIRGTQNAIIDLIAVRTLLGARIRLRLEQGRMPEAKEYLEALRKEPTYDTIANEMGKKIAQIKGRNATEQKKIDLLFAQTREMLVKNINSKLLRDLELEVQEAEANGGVLKRKKPEDPEVIK